MQSFNQHDYPEGQLHKTIVVTSEVWVSKDAEQKTRAVTILQFRGPNLLKSSELQRLNTEYRLSGRFNPPADQVLGTAPFKVGKQSWALVRQNFALSVQAGLGVDGELAHDLLVSLAGGK